MTGKNVTDGAPTAAKRWIDNVARGELKDSFRHIDPMVVAGKTALITGSGFGAGLVPTEASAYLLDLAEQFGAYKTLNVQRAESGKTKYPTIKGAYGPLSTPPIVRANAQAGKLNPQSVVSGSATDTESREVPVLIEASQAVVDDSSSDLAAIIYRAAATAIAGRFDYAAFAAAGADDTTDALLTGIFEHGDVPAISAQNGHNSLVGLDKEDCLRAIDGIADAALERGARWWCHPAVYKKLLRINDQSGAGLIQFNQGEPFLIGHPVTLSSVLPSTDAAGEKVLAFGCGEAALVAVRKDIRIEISDAPGFDRNVRQLRFIPRVYCTVAEPTWFSTLALAEA